MIVILIVQPFIEFLKHLRKLFHKVAGMGWERERERPKYKHSRVSLGCRNTATWNLITKILCACVRKITTSCATVSVNLFSEGNQIFYWKGSCGTTSTALVLYPCIIECIDQKNLEELRWSHIKYLYNEKEREHISLLHVLNLFVYHISNTSLALLLLELGKTRSICRYRKHHPPSPLRESHNMFLGPITVC